jgi:hypothetical protein
MTVSVTDPGEAKNGQKKATNPTNDANAITGRDRKPSLIAVKRAAPTLLWTLARPIMSRSRPELR